MPDDTKEQDRHEAPLNETEDRALNRRNILLGTTTLVAAATMTSGALAQAQKAAPAPAPPRQRPQAEHPVHHGRRHRLVQRQRLQSAASWATARPTSTASPGKARCLPTGTASKAAPPAARPSSPDNRRSAPG